MATQKENSLLYKVLKRNLHVCRYENNYARNEVMIRCPYCGDSIKDPSHAHFYIENKPPYRYECKRCSTSGIITEEVMRDLGFYDPEFVIMIVEGKKAIQSELSSSTSTTKRFNDRQHRITKTIIPPLIGDEMEEANFNYLSTRLGVKVDYDDYAKLKIVSNFAKFYEVNNLGNIAYDKYINAKLDIFDTKYLGFLSYDRRFITFRSRVNDPKLRRYEIINIYKSSFNNRKFYTMGTRINTLNPNFTLIISEGVIDILSVYYNIYNQESKENYVFAAVNGAGYRNVIMNFLRLGFLNLELIIYGDSDFIIKYKNLIRSFKLLPISSLTVYYNQELNPKRKTDFGVPKKDIERKVIRI